MSLQWSNVLTALKCPIGYVNHTTAVNWAVLQRACSVAAMEFDCILFHTTTDVARSYLVGARASPGSRHAAGFALLYSGNSDLIHNQLGRQDQPPVIARKGGE